MREPTIAVALLQWFGRDDALVGDILEEFEIRRSRLWLWRQVAKVILLGLPYGIARRPRQAPRMPMPIGGIGLVAIAILITVVAPGAWWLLGAGVAGGALLAVGLILATRRRTLRQPPGRRNVLLPLLLALAVPTGVLQAGQAPVAAARVDPIDGIVEAFRTL